MCILNRSQTELEVISCDFLLVLHVNLRFCTFALM